MCFHHKDRKYKMLIHIFDYFCGRNFKTVFRYALFIKT